MAISSCEGGGGGWRVGVMIVHSIGEIVQTSSYVLLKIFTEGAVAMNVRYFD